MGQIKSIRTVRITHRDGSVTEKRFAVRRERKCSPNYKARHPKIDSKFHYRVTTAKGVDYFSLRSNAQLVANRTHGKLERVKGDYWAKLAVN